MPAPASRVLALPVALLLAASTARAQTSNLADRPLRAVPVPNAAVAGAEEPAGLSVNPAAPGFVRGTSIQYFSERIDKERDPYRGDALFLSVPTGSLVSTLALDWIRPGTTSRFRRTTFGLALGGDALSLGGAFTWFHSPDAELERLTSWGGGLTLRPARWLSLGASATDRGMRLRGVALPARYAIGGAVRFWEDRVTVSTDLVASDRARDDFDPTGVAFGLFAELWRGFAFHAQVETPVNDGGDTRTLVGLAWNARNAGFSASYGNRGFGRETWVLGVRASEEAYRAPPAGHGRSVRLDLGRELERGGFLFFPGKSDPYGRLLGKLGELRDDDGVREVQLVIGDLPLGVGRTQELRSAVAELAARKPVVAYLRGGRMSEYWLASAARQIAAPPSGVVDLGGVSVTTPFLREGLAKIGVAFEVVAAGRYKNAPDPLVRSDMSEAQREVTEELLDRIFSAMLADIAASRHVEADKARAWVDQGLFTASDARAAGLVDRVAWPDELGGRRGGDGYRHTEPRRAQRWGPRPVIAVVPIEGAIVQGRSRRAPLVGQVVGEETIGREIRRAAEDGSVRAIVLRIDSPGGDALASDLIWREVMLARRRGKPVIASMGDVAASGGYFVASAADAIVAQPGTLTGSIGVFVVKPDFSGLLAKLGVNAVTLKRGENATLRSTTRAWSAGERAAVERTVQGFYDVFLSRVAEGRSLKKEEVDRVAAGRAWTGAEALERGLVDRLGSLSDAIALARERAGLSGDDAFDLRRYEPERGMLSSLRGADVDALSAVAGRVPEIAAAALLLEIDAPVALPPDWVAGSPAAAPSTAP